MIVPVWRGCRVIPADQRAERPARLINGMIHLADFEAVPGAKRHGRSLTATWIIGDGVGRVARDYAKIKSVGVTNIAGAAQSISNPLVRRPIRVAGDGYGCARAVLCC